jgi:transcriptional regulator with XRE-family HTH domain
MGESSSSAGKRLRAYRAEHGMSQSAFARLIPVHLVTVSQWERGVITPSSKRTEKIEEITGIPASNWREPLASSPSLPDPLLRDSSFVKVRRTDGSLLLLEPAEGEMYRIAWQEVTGD